MLLIFEVRSKKNQKDKNEDDQTYLTVWDALKVIIRRLDFIWRNRDLVYEL
jgi:hypothetical protein